MRHRCGMKRQKFIADVTKVLSCLIIAFALAFFPPTSAHAAMGVHDGHSQTEQSASHAAGLVHAHAAAQMDCGTSPEKSASNSGLHQCCAGMCLSAILIDSFASPQAEATAFDPVMHHSTFVAADANGFLRPPKHLI